MIIETLQYLLTPCSWTLRRLGYLNSQIGLGLRAGRCRRAWRPHLERTRNVIRAAAAECETRRKALVFGSGYLLDLPLADLAKTFRQVVLVDVVHPLRSYAAAAWYRNVRLLRADVTNTALELARVANDRSRPLPRSQPSLFLDDPEVDFVVSLNLASQLPVMPAIYLEKQKVRSDDEINAFAQDLLRAHFDYLQRLPGRVVLITDIEKLQVDCLDQIVNRYDILYEVEFPWECQTWTWELAPRGEINRDFSYHRTVCAVPDVKRAKRIESE